MEEVLINSWKGEECDLSLTGKCLGCTVLDCGCTSTVCGEVCLQCFMDTLSNDERKLIREYTGHKWFRFGDGKKFSF